MSKKKYSVVIPSAILVPESMRSVGDLPAVVYPLSKGTVFDYLYRQYADAEEIVIVGFQNIDEIERRVIPYSRGNVRIVTLPELGSLCTTVRYGIESLKDKQAAVVVNFSDTIAHGSVLASKDSFYCSRERYSNEWTFYENAGGKIRVTYDRSDSAVTQSGKGDAFVGVFRFDRPEDFISAIEATESCPVGESTSWFYRALELYSSTWRLNPIEPDDWFDIGHPSGYVSAQLQVKAREFNHIEIDRNRAILRKSSDEVDKFIGEIKWYLKLPIEVSYAAPRVFSYSLDYAKPWLSMEYYPYHTLHTLWLSGHLDRARWGVIFDRLAFVLADFARYKVIDDPIKVSGALRSMYLDKTVRRLDMLRDNKAFAQFFGSRICVNGQGFPSLDDIECKLRKIVPEYLCAGDAPICLIHGDLCFPNIMVDDSLSFVKLIDPRGSFGPYDIYGDQRYELAKLAHSVDGNYDLIIKDEFSFSHEPGSTDIAFEVNRPQSPDLYEIMKEGLSSLIGDSLGEIELIEALLFLSMIPLHGESLEQQMVMLGTGLELLRKAMKELN